MTESPQMKDITREYIQKSRMFEATNRKATELMTEIIQRVSDQKELSIEAQKYAASFREILKDELSILEEKGGLVLEKILDEETLTAGISWFSSPASERIRTTEPQFQKYMDSLDEAFANRLIERIQKLVRTTNGSA